jgi:para-nitrobenzyl esterase
MNQDLAVVTTSSATVTGRRREDGGSEFRGIRYATGTRFTRPTDVSPDGDVFALEFGAICPQVPGFLEQTLGLDASSMSEDCFYLNVYVPEGASASSSLPVLFWIHGGAYTNGAGSLDWYHGSSLAKRGTVVVSINYRLGIFGFLGEENYGTEDMMSALRWRIRSCIASCCSRCRPSLSQSVGNESIYWSVANTRSCDRDSEGGLCRGGRYYS